MAEKQKRDQGFLYNANYDEEILADINKCNDLCHEFNQIKPSDRETQTEILKQIFHKMGESVYVNTPFWCDYGYNTTVGDYFFANHNCQILDGGKVTFGDHVFIAPNCTFTTAEHALDVEQRNEGLEVALPITIGNNVWIGAGTIVLGGVTIGDNTVIGAGSVVTKDIPSNVIAVGVPCRVMREITEADKDRYPHYKGEKKYMRYTWLDEYLMKKSGVTKNTENWNWVRYMIGDKMFVAVCLDENDKPYYITLKLEPLEGEFFRSQYEDIVPGYYMNKVHWNSIKPDGEVPDDLLKELVDKSYNLILKGFSKKRQQEILNQANN